MHSLNIVSLLRSPTLLCCQLLFILLYIAFYVVGVSQSRPKVGEINRYKINNHINKYRQNV